MLIPIVIHKDPKSAYGVVVPDVPGCYAAEDSMEKAMASARTAIEVHIETLIDEGMTVPEIADIEDHRSNPDYAEGIWAMVEIDPATFAGKLKRVNVMLPENILSKIDIAAKLAGDSRSQYLTQAAVDRLMKFSGGMTVSSGSVRDPGRGGIVEQSSKSRGKKRGQAVPSRRVS